LRCSRFTGQIPCNDLSRNDKGNTSFKEYFESQPESFKRSWLGPKCYELYKEGKYNPMSLGNPDTGYRVPVEDLR
jgi:hypothetical protein